MFRPSAHCPPTENVLPLPKVAILLARAIWETTREENEATFVYDRMNIFPSKPLPEPSTKCNQENFFEPTVVDTPAGA